VEAETSHAEVPVEADVGRAAIVVALEEMSIDVRGTAVHSSEQTCWEEGLVLDDIAVMAESVSASAVTLLTSRLGPASGRAGGGGLPCVGGGVATVRVVDGDAGASGGRAYTGGVPEKTTMSCCRRLPIVFA
jgi:hypothetical protein